MISFAKDFQAAAAQVTSQFELRAFLRRALGSYEATRGVTSARYQNWSDARQAASEIKWEAINHLDKLPRGIHRQARGARHARSSSPATADAGARLHPRKSRKENKVRTIIKSKSMTAEEIRPQRCART